MLKTKKETEDAEVDCSVLLPESMCSLPPKFASTVKAGQEWDLFALLGVNTKPCLTSNEENNNLICRA